MVYPWRKVFCWPPVLVESCNVLRAARFVAETMESVETRGKRDFVSSYSRQHHRVLSLDPASLMSEVDYLADLGQSFQHSLGIVDAHKYSSRTQKSQKYGDLEVALTDHNTKNRRLPTWSPNSRFCEGIGNEYQRDWHDLMTRTWQALMCVFCCASWQTGPSALIILFMLMLFLLLSLILHFRTATTRTTATTTVATNSCD